MKFLVDSAERTSGTPEEYTFRIWSEIKNVRGVRLLQAIVPKSTPNLGGDLLSFEFQFSSGNISSTNYQGGVFSGSDLAAKLQAIAQTATGQSTATVQYSADEDTRGKLTITAATSTTLDAFIVGNEFTARVLGITWVGPTTTTISPATRVVTLDNPIDMTFPEYLICDIDFGYGTSMQFSTDANAHSFIVPMVGNYGDVIDFTAANGYSQFDPLPNIAILAMKVRWLPPQGYSNQWFTFQGKNHQLLFEVY